MGHSRRERRARFGCHRRDRAGKRRGYGAFSSGLRGAGHLGAPIRQAGVPHAALHHFRRPLDRTCRQNHTNLEGTQQSGIAFDLKIADIARDGQLVQLARDEAKKIIDNDPTCEKTEYQLLWTRLKELRKTNINWAAIS